MVKLIDQSLKLILKNLNVFYKFLLKPFIPMVTSVFFYLHGTEYVT